MCGYKLATNLTKFQENIFSLSENISKRFRGGGLHVLLTLYIITCLRLVSLRCGLSSMT